MLSLKLGEPVEKFREEFRLWLSSNKPPTIDDKAPLSEYVAVSREWQRKLAEARFVGVHFPEKFGGRGLSIVEEAVAQEELSKVNSPQLVGIFGLTMVGPVLIKHGSEEQRERYLKKILTAEELWCQGFSEPEAGSDLASVRTKAEREGGGWKITGQKIWTSFAQYAEHCFLLARSDSSVAKHKGLSYFFVQMKLPGIDIRPLTQITGEQEFNEVFFDQVLVPEANIVGKPGQGWEIAISTLMYERVALTFSRHLQSERALNEIKQFVLSRNRPDELREFGRLRAKSMAVRALALSHLMTYNSGNTPGPEGSMDKLFWSETFQEICSFGVSLMGPVGIFTGGDCAESGGVFPHRYLYSRGRTIAAGTSEIQRNIIAQRILGLPKD